MAKNCIEQWRADIVCLQETKLQGDIQEIVKHIWGGRWVKYGCLEASGAKGGNIMLCDSKVWKGEVLQKEVHTLTCSFEATPKLQRLHFKGVCTKL